MIGRRGGAVRCQRFLTALGLILVGAATAAAQDQTIIVEQPLQLCGAANQFPSARLEPAAAEQLVKAALGGAEPDDTTYYIIHATEFVKTRMVTAAEHWYVFYKPWQQKSAGWWIRDSRQFKHFTEQRIFGSSRVAIGYLYVNVPTYTSRNALEEVAEFFLARHEKEQREADEAAGKELDTSNPGMASTARQNALRAKRQERIKTLEARLEDELPDQDVEEAAKQATAREAATRKAAVTTAEKGDVNARADLYRLSALEAERYFKALAENRSAIVDEFPLVNRDTGETLAGLSPTLATAASYKSLVDLFYRIDVTKKLPAPVQNLKEALKLAFVAEADVANRLGVPV